MSIVDTFVKLQRAAVVLEILVAKGQLEMAKRAVSEIHSSLQVINTHIGEYMSEDKNFKTEKIEGGEDTPQNNQGTIPNPFTGSNTGVGNSDRGQFKDSGSTDQNPKPGPGAPPKAPEKVEG